MAVSKVIYDGETLIDLTVDTIEADKILNGYTAHDKAGNKIIGNVSYAHVYTGSSTPSSSLGSNNDIYIKI